MSSQEDNHDEDVSRKEKKRRIRRACDMCRRKKVKCDGEQRSEQACSYCVANEHECTYYETNKKRYLESYVRGLETRLVKMEKLLQRVCPGIDLNQDLDAIPAGSRFTAPITNAFRPTESSETSAPVFRNSIDADELYPSDDEIAARKTLEEGFKNMSLDNKSTDLKYFGKSSSIMLIWSATDLKNEILAANGISKQVPLRRQMHWRVDPWVAATHNNQSLDLSFPEGGLMYELSNHYFHSFNAFTPLLHRPTFEDSIKDGLHLRERGFAFVVLLVCALGSRCSSDPRVLLEGTDDVASSGWKWFIQVREARKIVNFAPSTLYDLQIACLTVMYLSRTSSPHASWAVVGVGIKAAHDIGAHRRKMYGPTPSVNGELMKRAFWILITMDRGLSSGLGRPCSVQHEDFDLDLPVECDDEYWVKSESGLQFKQPVDKPSQIAHFNHGLRLGQIHSFVLRTIYAINKSKALLGYVGPRWEEHIVSEIDSALNKWVDLIPEHLKWDPKCKDTFLLQQSASLYVRYYSLQIMVHRPFIPSPRKPSPISFPSLAICTNAARACIRILDIVFNRGIEESIQYQVLDATALFAAAIIILFNIWGGKLAGLTRDPEKEMVEVHKAMKILKAQEVRFPTSGHLLDVLCDLADAGDLPYPEQYSSDRKRPRDHETVVAPSNPPSVSSAPSEPRKMAGSNRVMRDPRWSQSPHVQSAAPSPPMTFGIQDTDGTFRLPFLSSELGQIPVYPGPLSAFAPADNQPSPPVVPENSWSSLHSAAQSMGPNPAFSVSDTSEFEWDPAFFVDRMFSMDPLLSTQLDDFVQGSSSVVYTAHNGVFTGSGQPQDTMFVDQNALSDMWSYMPPPSSSWGS